MADSLIGNLAVLLSMDTAEFATDNSKAQKLLAKTQKQFEAVGKKITGIGKSLSIGLTLPLAAFGTVAIREATETAHAMGQVEAALKSMGPVAGRTSQQLKAAADSMEMNSLYEGDEILTQLTANLLTFGKVSGTVFDRAQQAAVDMSARLGGGLQGSAIMLGKALNDPAKGITALTRAGVSFTAQQKAQIKAMAASGKTAQAQAMILDEVENQFRGAAKAAADADPFHKATVAFKQMAETVGVALLPLIPPLTDAVVSVVDAFSSLSPETQKWVIIAGGAAAALGPLMVAFGSITSGIGTILPLIVRVVGLFSGLGSAGAAGAAGLGAISGVLLPIAAAVGAVYLAWKNWDTIGPMLRELGEAIWTAIGPTVLAAMESIKTTVMSLWNGPFGSTLKTVMSVWLQFGEAMVKVLGPVALALLRGFVTVVAEVFAQVGRVLNTLAAFLSGDFAGAWEGLKSIVSNAFTGILRVIEAMVPGALGWLRRLWEGVKTWLVDKMWDVINLALAPIRAVEKSFAWLYDKVVGHSYVPDMVDEIAAHMARLDTAMVQPANKAAAKTTEAFRKMAEDVRPLLDRLFPDAAAIRQYQDELALIDRAEKAGPGKGGLSAEQAQAARDRLGREGLEKDDDAPSFEDADPLLTVQPGLDELLDKLPKVRLEANKTTGEMIEGFANMAEQVVGSLRSMVSAFKGGDILGGIQQLLSVVVQVAQAFGQLKGGTSAPAAGKDSGGGSFFGGFRAAGGPTVPGKSYVVGEEGPEWFTPGVRGFVTPSRGNNQQARVMIVPTPYFDAVVDGRAATVAAPMAMQAERAGSLDARRRIAHRQSRIFP